MDGKLEYDEWKYVFFFLERLKRLRMFVFNEPCHSELKNKKNMRFN